MEGVLRVKDLGERGNILSAVGNELMYVGNPAKEGFQFFDFFLERHIRDGFHLVRVWFNPGSGDDVDQEEELRILKLSLRRFSYQLASARCQDTGVGASCALHVPG